MPFFSETPGQMQQVQRFTPEIQNLLSQLAPMGLQQIQQGRSMMDPQALEQREMQRFNEDTLPGMFERFTSMGKGAQSSGAFQGMQARGAADLGSSLAGLRAQLGLQNQQLGQGLLGQGLTPSFENIYRPREASGVEAMIPQAIEAAGRVGGAYLTGGTSEILPLITKLLSSFGS